MSNTIYGVATVEVILPSQTITGAVTTTAFDVSDYASGQVEVVVVVESNGGAGSIDYKVQYSPTDAISSGALVDPQDLEKILRWIVDVHYVMNSQIPSIP